MMVIMIAMDRGDYTPFSTTGLGGTQTGTMLVAAPGEWASRHVDVVLTANPWRYRRRWSNVILALRGKENCVSMRMCSQIQHQRLAGRLCTDE